MAMVRYGQSLVLLKFIKPECAHQVTVDISVALSAGIARETNMC